MARKYWAAALLLGSMACAASASAQATRTWVSGVGDDMNPCSRTAPCKTFAGAIAKTAAGGEINCIDPGGFGGVTIVKSIAIMCDHVTAGVLVPHTNGIVVNVKNGDKVVLSGLDIFGAGTGLTGVRVVKGNVLIRNATIQGFSAAGSKGVSNEGTGHVIVTDSVIVNNTTGVNGKVVSAGNNLLTGNGVDGTFASTIRLK